MKGILKMTETNVKIHSTHGLEEFILLKCPYYPKQYTDTIGIFNETRTTLFIEETLLSS